MTRAAFALAAAVLVSLGGCADNVSVGNDREAQLDPPEKPAEVVAPGAAIAGIAAGLIRPQIMTDADLANVPAVTNRCVFRMTKVGEPVLVYGSQAVLKLNGKLAPLPASGTGSYGADGITATVRPVAGGAESDGPFEAEFVLRLPGTPDELGFRGYAEC